MPSPRRPSRAITTRSVTGGPDQELAIAVAAEDRGGEDANDPPAPRSHEAGNLVAHSRVNLRVADDPLLCRAPPGFELRFDQRNEPCWPARQGERRRQDELERNEAHVDDDGIGRLREEGRG